MRHPIRSFKWWWMWESWRLGPLGPPLTALFKWLAREKHREGLVYLHGDSISEGLGGTHLHDVGETSQ